MSGRVAVGAKLFPPERRSVRRTSKRLVMKIMQLTAAGLAAGHGDPALTQISGHNWIASSPKLLAMTGRRIRAPGPSYAIVAPANASAVPNASIAAAVAAQSLIANIGISLFCAAMRNASRV